MSTSNIKFVCFANGIDPFKCDVIAPSTVTHPQHQNHENVIKEAVRFPKN